MMNTLAWGASVSAPFRKRVIQMAAQVGGDPSWYMAIFKFESNLNPKAVNAMSGATGLIQWMPSTAIRFGTTVQAIAQMTDLEQLDLAERYFQPFKGRLNTIEDAYMAVLMPTGVGKLPSYKLITSDDGKAYIQNKGLDLNSDGNITKAEAASFVVRLYDEGMRQQQAVEITPVPTPAQPEKPMGALALLTLFGPILKDLIPQIASIFKPGSEVANRNVALAETLVNTIVTTTGTANMQAAVEKMQTDPAVLDNVKKAVVTEPTVMAALQITEVAGGAAAARAQDLKVMEVDKPFWKSSAVFWVSILLLPMVYWFIGSVVAGGVNIPDAWPWYAQVPFKLLGTEWNGESRSGIANLVIGLVLGGICGVYYGISVTQQKQQTPNSTRDTQQG